jgi:hypothetical protein
MSGLQLSSMELSDMLDVIHVIFEEDHTNILSGEHIEAKEKVRQIVYRDFYERKPQFGGSSIRDNIPETIEKDGYYGEEAAEEIKLFDPSGSTVKPYMALSDVDSSSIKPFGKEIDAPLG